MAVCNRALIAAGFLMVMFLSTHARIWAQEAPDVNSRYKISVNKIDPVKEEGVVLKDRGGNVLRIGGPISGLMRPGDCTLEVKVKGATISDLTLAEPCELKVLSDKTLVADRENILGKDSKQRSWKSRKVMLGGREMYVFIKL